MANESRPLDPVPRLDVTLTDDSATPPVAEPVRDELAPLRPVDPGRYELRGEHGRGGLGVVMRVFDRQLGREVAMKLLQNPSPEATRRFLREATITSRLQHPSIVAVHDVVRWVDGHPSYTMPLYPGRSLRVAIDEAKDLRARMALLPKALSVVEAIAHAHGRGVIHRDLKPSNVLLGSLGETVVIDWGLAKALDAPDSIGDAPAATAADPLDATRVGQIMGTPAYMAPEQARAEPVDRRADVYSLGALLYCLLAGKPPYEAPSSAEALTKLLDGPPADIATQVDGVPPDLATIVRKAMARDPAARYPDADALKRDLERFLTGNLVEAHTYSPLALVWRWIARHRVVSAALVLIVAVVAVSFRRIQVERSVALAAATREKLRSDAMILTQAETSLTVDPTQSIAYLKTYPDDGADWVRVRAIARDAIKRGVARHVMRLRQPISDPALPWDHGRRLLVVDGPNVLALADPSTGRQSITCLGADLSNQLRDESFGRELVTLTRDGELRVWNADLGASELLALVPEAEDASLSSDGAWVALTTHGGLAELVERRTGRILPLAVPDAPVSEARFVPGTTYLLVTADTWRPTIYDVGSGRVVYNGAPGIIRSYVPASGRYLVIIRRGAIEWIDTSTFETHGLGVTVRIINEALAVLPDGRLVVSEWLTRKASVWDPRSGQVTPTPSYVGTLAAAGPWVAGFDPTSVLLMDPSTNEQRPLYGHGRVMGASVTFMGGTAEEPTTLISLAEGVARVWDLTPSAAVTWRLGRRLYAPPFAVMEGGKSVLASGQDGRLYLRPLDAAGAPVELLKLPARASLIRAESDGVHALMITLDGRLLRVDVHTRQVDVVGTDVPSLQQFEISRDGSVAVGISYHESKAMLWNLATHQQTSFLELQGRCMEATVAPDARTAVIGCGEHHDRSYTRVDLATGATSEVPFPSSLVHIIGFSPSGRYFFAITAAGDLLRWTWATGELDRRHVHASHGLTGLVLTDDLVFTTGGDGLEVTMFSSGVSHLIDRSPLIGHLVYEAHTGFLGGIATGEGDRVSLWNLRSGETWNVSRFGSNEPIAITDDAHLVVAGFDGILRIFTPPGTLTATPAETRAWLESVTSMRLGEDPLAPTTSCE